MWDDVDIRYKSVMFTTHFPGNGLLLPAIYGDDWGMVYSYTMLYPH